MTPKQDPESEPKKDNELTDATAPTREPANEQDSTQQQEGRTAEDAAQEEEWRQAYLLQQR